MAGPVTLWCPGTVALATWNLLASRTEIRDVLMESSSKLSQVTHLLAELQRGEPARTDELLQLVYDELRRLARARLAHEAPDHTLQPTALVHEAYLRLLGDAEQRWDTRGHFFAAAAEAMRRILIESARNRQRLKRGGELDRVSLQDVAAVESLPKEDLLALDEALRAFAESEPAKARLVELRYFAGLNEAEAAEVLGISRATAARWWAFSKAWLFDHLGGKA